MPTEEGQVAKVHDEGFEAEGVVQVSPQDQDGGIQVSPRVQVSPQEHFGGSQVAPRYLKIKAGSQDSPRGQFGGPGWREPSLASSSSEGAEHNFEIWWSGQAQEARG